jgi:hypothetical protein
MGDLGLASETWEAQIQTRRPLERSSTRYLRASESKDPDVAIFDERVFVRGWRVNPGAPPGSGVPESRDEPFKFAWIQREKLQKITMTYACQANNRIGAQIATKTVAILRKSAPTPVSTNTIVPRGTISEVWSTHS